MIVLFRRRVMECPLVIAAKNLLATHGAAFPWTTGRVFCHCNETHVSGPTADTTQHDRNNPTRQSTRMWEAQYKVFGRLKVCAGIHLPPLLHPVLVLWFVCHSLETHKRRGGAAHQVSLGTTQSRMQAHLGRHIGRRVAARICSALGKCFVKIGMAVALD